jgi:hypothetical protein
VSEEREWHVLVRESDGGMSRYVYKRPAGERPPTLNEVIEVAPLKQVVVLDIEPKEPGPSEVGIIRGRPPKRAP